MRWSMWLPLLVLCGASCKKVSDDDDDDDATCTVGEPDSCPGGEVCEDVDGGEPACFAPLSVSGWVYDLADDGGVEGARVVARDANGAALSSVAVTAADGTYELAVPTRRDADGQPIGDAFTLRADAAGYVSFPVAPRTALPLDPEAATVEDPVLTGVAADIGLLALDDAGGLGSIAGRVDAGSAETGPGGTLVVGGGRTAVADRDGTFVVFNVAPGSVEVAGYRQGLNLNPASAEVEAGERTEGVVLEAEGAAEGSASGTVQIVNAPGGAVTSVILVVEDTFDAQAIRGEAPAGLRAAGVTGDWSIEGVPDGRYVVLAAFENDDLVRDPDTSIGGTDIVTIDVRGGEEVVDGFKVTEALAVIGPGADEPDLVSAPLTLEWVDDSSEDEYEVEVFDALGNLVWGATVEGPRGNDPASVAYDGPLESGMVYQFRATSIKDGVPLSTTEDLRGVFQAK